MTFTDDDLAKWKYALQNIWAIKVDRNEADALLARLEAAEKGMDFLILHHFTTAEKEIKAWRKAAGKENV